METAHEEFERFMLQALEKTSVVIISDSYMDSEWAEDICNRNNLSCEHFHKSRSFDFKKNGQRLFGDRDMPIVKIHQWRKGVDHA